MIQRKDSYYISVMLWPKIKGTEPAFGKFISHENWKPRQVFYFFSMCTNWYACQRVNMIFSLKLDSLILSNLGGRLGIDFAKRIIYKIDKIWIFLKIWIYF